jgi:hypothetical protein
MHADFNFIHRNILSRINTIENMMVVGQLRCNSGDLFWLRTASVDRISVAFYYVRGPHPQYVVLELREVVNSGSLLRSWWRVCGGNGGLFGWRLGGF